MKNWHTGLDCPERYCSYYKGDCTVAGKCLHPMREREQKVGSRGGMAKRGWATPEHIRATFEKEHAAMKREGE